MRKKRLCAWLLSLLMMVSLLPVSAAAAEGGDDVLPEQLTQVTAEDSSGHVHVQKSVSGSAEEGNLTLQLEAWATDSVTTVTSDKPLDIVLVLDVSGSMKDNMTSYTYTYTKVERQQWSYNNIKWDRQNYYWQNPEDKQYYQVEWDEEWTESWIGWRINAYILKADGQELGRSDRSDGTAYKGDLYVRKVNTTTTTKKIDALKTAVNNFIDSVAKSTTADGKPVGHKLSTRTKADLRTSC